MATRNHVGKGWPCNNLNKEENMTETIMSEYIAGFNAGYAYVLDQIERHPHLTMAEILTMLRGEQEQQPH
jgi:hypothetical protein